MSKIWAPVLSGGKHGLPEDGFSLLTRTGFVNRPSERAGVFHYLPLGLRVLEKLEKLLDHTPIYCQSITTAMRRFVAHERQQSSGFNPRPRHQA